MSVSLTRDELSAALARVGRGDRVAFRDVYESTSAKLMGVCLRILSDRQLAEDVLQETYVTVWRKAGAFDASRASPITWLVTIARNRSIDRLRSGAAARKSVPVDQAHDLADDGAPADELVAGKEEVVRLAGCLDELDARTSTAIRTAFFQGATYEQLAAAQGTPLGTMKSWIRRGLLRLRSCLER
jgi:RNA polymerase sigma-70 factor (ECF subfamily)